MKTTEKWGLTPNEMNLIYDVHNSTIPSLDYLNWRENEISRFIECNEYYDLETKWEVDFEAFIEKLEGLSEIEMLEIFDDVKVFWGITDYSYHWLGDITPQEKMQKIKNEMFNPDCL